MNISNQSKRTRVFIILRLFIVTLLLFLAHYVFHMSVLLFYYVIAVVCILSFIYLAWLIWGKWLNWLIWVQVIFDCLVETILVYYTGGVDSLFAPIYVLSIISAGILIAPGASFLIASFSSVLFALLVISNYFELIPAIFPAVDPAVQVERNSLYLFYATYVRITIFFVVAILTHYMTITISRLEEKVRIQERLAFLGDIASRIAHEIRNPLAAISGSIEVLADELKPVLSGKNLQLMNAVTDESDRLKRIFGKILDYSRITELKPQRTVLNQLIDHVLLMFENSKEFGSNICIVKKYSSEKIFADIDAEYMTDVFSNILRNAVEAMPEGGNIDVEMNQLEDESVVTITDSGEGIKKEALKTLFLPFKTTKKTGTGLGLAQAHKIITLHGGRIEVKPHYPKGTQVRIVLRQLA